MNHAGRIGRFCSFMCFRMYFVMFSRIFQAHIFKFTRVYSVFFIKKMLNEGKYQMLEYKQILIMKAMNKPSLLVGIYAAEAVTQE